MGTPNSILLNSVTYGWFFVLVCYKWISIISPRSTSVKKYLTGLGNINWNGTPTCPGSLVHSPPLSIWCLRFSHKHHHTENNAESSVEVIEPQRCTSVSWELELKGVVGYECCMLLQGLVRTWSEWDSITRWGMGLGSRYWGWEEQKFMEPI